MKKMVLSATVAGLIFLGGFLITLPKAENREVPAESEVLPTASTAEETSESELFTGIETETETTSESTTVEETTATMGTEDSRVKEFKSKYQVLMDMPTDEINVNNLSDLEAALAEAESLPDSEEKEAIFAQLKDKQKEALRQYKQLKEFANSYKTLLEKPLAAISLQDEAQVREALDEVNKYQESQLQQKYKAQLEQFWQKLEILKALKPGKQNQGTQTDEIKPQKDPNLQSLDALKTALKNQENQIKKLQDMLKSANNKGSRAENKPVESAKQKQEQKTPATVAPKETEAAKKAVELYYLPKGKEANKWYPDTILELPWKTTYNNGEKARLEGLVVQFVKYVPYKDGLHFRTTANYFYDKNNTLFKGWRLKMETKELKFEDEKSPIIDFFFVEENF